MYEIGVARTFRALHQLVEDEIEEHDHGHEHDYRAEAIVRGKTLAENGMLLDIDRLSEALAACLAELDAADLDVLPAFAGVSTTVEVVAQHIWERVRGAIDVSGLDSLRVVVHESTEAWAAVDRRLED